MTESLGTRQMKWIDTLRYLYRQETYVKKVWWGGCEKLNSPTTHPNEDVYPYDHRFTFDGELVFDFDVKPPLDTIEKLYPLIRDVSCFLETVGVEHFVFASGGRGVHIHVFCDSKNSAIRCSRSVVSSLYLNKLCGYGRPIDANLLANRHWIRMIGGRKLVGWNRVAYKTMVSLEDGYPKPKYVRRDVVFPHQIRLQQY